MMLSNITVFCNVQEVLKKLQENKAEHIKLVRESKQGYLIKAEEVLNKKLNKIKNGEVSALHFSLLVPKDYTSEYNTAIGMLEMHTEDDIALSASDFKQFVQNEWDWVSTFVLSNSMYSTMLRTKSLSVPEGSSWKND